MPFNISTNSAAASAGYYLGKNQSALQKSLTRLASGKKIIAPYDDPGSLSVSMKLQASINRLAGAENNVKNAISFLEVQDGIMSFAGRIVDRMAELKGLSSQDPMKSSLDQASYNDEFRDLQIQLYQMSQQTFNGVSLFAQYITDANGQPDTSTETQFRGSTAQDNTLTIFTSSDGSTGSRVSVHKSAYLSALTIELLHRALMERPVGVGSKYENSSTVRHSVLLQQVWRYLYPGSDICRGVCKGSGKYRFTAGTERRDHVQTHIFCRNDLADAYQYEGSSR